MGSIVGTIVKVGTADGTEVIEGLIVGTSTTGDSVGTSTTGDAVGGGSTAGDLVGTIIVTGDEVGFLDGRLVVG